MTLSESLQNHILSLCDDSVIVIDTQFRIVEVNDNLLSFTRSNRESLLGRQLTLLAKPSMQLTLQQTGFWYGKLESEIPIDKLDNLWCSIVAYRYESVEITHYIGIIDHLWQENNFLERIASSDSFDDTRMIALSQGSEHTVKWILDHVRMGIQVDAEDSDLALNPYGEAAKTQILAGWPFVIHFVDECVELLVAKFVQDVANQRIKDQFMQDHRGHLLAIFDPLTSLASLRELAKKRGRKDMLTQMSYRDALQMYSFTLQYILSNFIHISSLKELLAKRLSDEMMLRYEEMDAVLSEYIQSAMAPFTTGDNFAKIKQIEIEKLGELSGIIGAVLYRPLLSGELIGDALSRQAADINILLTSTEDAVMLDDTSPRGAGTVARAARSGEIIVDTNYAESLNHPIWIEMVHKYGVQSIMAIPVYHKISKQLMVVALYGEYENQFLAPWMKSFAHQLKRRWEFLWQQFDPMTESIVLEQKRSEEYRKRLFTGGLVMYCQPIVALESGRVTKVEALARLRLEDGTMVPPNQFLPLLDRSEMDRLFLLGFEESARYLTKWKTMGFNVDITVNLPPHTLLNPAIIVWIEEICHRYQLAPERFTLELLETQEIDDEAQQLVLKQLKELGVKLAVDDLGSGYSSLMRLIQLPFDVVKIEQGLLSKLADNIIPMFGLIHGLIQIGTGLGKEVVVEGIEYPGIIEAMKIFRATMGQGYVLARPMPFDDVYLWAHSYHLKVEWTGIHTYVGALAYQWLSIQQNRQRLIEVHELCPLTPFFQEKGEEASEVAKWHEAIHNHVHVKMNQQRLLNWLIDRAQQELNEKRK